MIPPNTMCSPPNPAAISQLPHAAGPNSAAAPATMKHSPITGTIRTENAPPVTNPVPYNSSQVPGSACHSPARYSATVSRPPTTIGGRNLNPKRRPGPERIGSFTAYAFRTMAEPPIVSATSASPSHARSHSSGVRCRAARKAAASAVAPTATWPHPGTAVNDPARSIVCRMKRRLSSARSRNGWGEVIPCTIGNQAVFVKYFVMQRHYAKGPCAPTSPSTWKGSRASSTNPRPTPPTRPLPPPHDGRGERRRRGGGGRRRRAAAARAAGSGAGVLGPGHARHGLVSPELQDLERQAARQNADAASVTLAPGDRAVDQDHDDPRDPARALAPRQALEHEPRLGVRRRPRLPIPLREGDGPRDDAVGAEAVRARAREVPHARHLAPAVVVARAHHQQVVLRRELQDPAAGRGREAQGFGGAVHDLEPVHPRLHERREVAPVVAPVFRERGEPDRALAVQLAEQRQHPAGVAAVGSPVDGRHRAERHDVLLVHAPLDAGEQSYRLVDRVGKDHVVVGDV